MGPPSCPARAHAALARATLRSRSLVLSQRRWGQPLGKPCRGLASPRPWDCPSPPGHGGAGCPRPLHRRPSQGLHPAPRGRSMACWAEPCGQSPAGRDGLSFQNPACSDRGTKKVVAGGSKREEQTKRERETRRRRARLHALLPLGDEGLPLLRLWPRPRVAQAPQHPLAAGAVAGPRGEDIVSARGGRLLHPHHQPLLILLG